MLTSNRPVDDWGKLLGDTAAVTALLDRLLHHGHVLPSLQLHTGASARGRVSGASRLARGLLRGGVRLRKVDSATDLEDPP